jgi:hypothetical protein
MYPSSHRHTLLLHIPCPEQSFKQNSISHASPLNPGGQ